MDLLPRLRRFTHVKSAVLSPRTSPDIELTREAADEIDRLQELLSELYQVLGALDADDEVLTRVLAASEGRPFSNEPSLLPYVPD